MSVCVETSNCEQNQIARLIKLDPDVELRMHDCNSCVVEGHYKTCHFPAYRKRYIMYLNWTLSSCLCHSLVGCCIWRDLDGAGSCYVPLPPFRGFHIPWNELG